jgi:hypothetical protein
MENERTTTTTLDSLSFPFGQQNRREYQTKNGQQKIKKEKEKAKTGTE